LRGFPTQGVTDAHIIRGWQRIVGTESLFRARIEPVELSLSRRHKEKLICE